MNANNTLLIVLFLATLLRLSSAQSQAHPTQHLVSLPAQYTELESERLQVTIMPNFKGFEGPRDQPYTFLIIGHQFTPPAPPIEIDAFSQVDISADSPLRKNPLAAAISQVFLVKTGQFKEARSFVRSSSSASEVTSQPLGDMQSAFWSDSTLEKVQINYKEVTGIVPILMWKLNGSTILFLSLRHSSKPPTFGASRLSIIDGHYFIHPPILNAMSSNPQLANLYNAYLSESMNLGNFVFIEKVQ